MVKGTPMMARTIVNEAMAPTSIPRMKITPCGRAGGAKLETNPLFVTDVLL
jgi:hypothetical protein